MTYTCCFLEGDRTRAQAEEHVGATKHRRANTTLSREKNEPCGMKRQRNLAACLAILADLLHDRRRAAVIRPFRRPAKLFVPGAPIAGRQSGKRWLRKLRNYARSKLALTGLPDTDGAGAAAAKSCKTLAKYRE